MEKRNVVLIGADCIRADHCSCYGYNRKTTPFIDKIANRGMKFKNPIVSSVPTIPSFYGIFTGEYYPFKTVPPINPEDLRRALYTKETLCDALSKDGYNTYGVTTNPDVSRYGGFNKGFQHFYDDLSVKKAKRKDQGWLWKLKKDYIVPFLKKHGISLFHFAWHFIKNDFKWASSEDYFDGIYSTLRGLEEPYFLWIFLIDTHHPYTPPAQYTKWEIMRTRKSIWVHYKLRKKSKLWRMEKLRKKKIRLKWDPQITREESQMLINAYDGEIFHVDSIVKQLWEHLKDTNPVFIFHADHGEGFGEHGIYSHPREHYENLIRVPLIIYNTDQKGIMQKPVSLLELPSTICELAEIKSEFKSPNVFGNTYAQRPPIIQHREQAGLKITVRGKEWKLITNPDRMDELYNIKRDPFEQNNLIGTKDVENDLRNIVDKHKRTIMEREKLTKKYEG